MLAFVEHNGRCRLAISDRFGGVSAPPYDGLNLALHVGDEAAAVRANRALLAAELGLPVERLVFMEQVHGGDVAVISAPPDPDGALPRADALVTDQAGLALVVLVADCTPVLAVDPEAGVVGVAHAGRAGLVAGIVPAMLDAMGGLGAGAVQVWIGPSICADCYPVPLELREEVAAVAPAARTVDRRGEPALAIAAGVLAQLSDRGIAAEWLDGCSAEDDAFYSYRRDGRTGRYAGVAVLS